MSDPHPGNAAPNPPLRLPLTFGKRGVDPAARVRRRVGSWVRELAEVGATVGSWMLEIARSRHANNRLEDNPIDLDLGLSLLQRATRWIAALRARLAAENEAARIGVNPFERLFDRPDRAVDCTLRPQTTERPEPVEARDDGRDDCIEGMPTADVVAQICADLETAAGMLNMPRTRRQIAEIAAAARKLLGVARPALSPVCGTSDGPECGPPPVSLRAIAPPAPAPDTG
jgi:hypothetical protein